MNSGSSLLSLQCVFNWHTFMDTLLNRRVKPTVKVKCIHSVYPVNHRLTIFGSLERGIVTTCRGLQLVKQNQAWREVSMPCCCPSQLARSASYEHSRLRHDARRWMHQLMVTAVAKALQVRRRKQAAHIKGVGPRPSSGHVPQPCSLPHYPA